MFDKIKYSKGGFLVKKNDNNVKKERRGMFFALAICLVSIGIASLGTYNSVSNYLDEQNLNSQTQEQSADVSLTTSDEDDPELENDTDVSEQAIESEDTTSSLQIDEEVNVESSNDDIEPDVSQANTETSKPSYTLSSSYSLPVSSMTILQGFSGDTLVYNETMKDYRSHNGVDISSYVGETVYAVNNGLVLDTFNDLLLGNVVSVEHGDYEVWYCGLGSTFLVEAGEVIEQGTAIGSVKEVPFEASEECHIHIEVRVDGELIDPLSIDFF